MIKSTKFKDICKEKDWTKKFQKLLMESNSEVITFSPGEIEKRFSKLIKQRQEVDKKMDELLMELSGIK